MAVDYLKIFRQGKKPQAPPAPARDTHKSDAQTPGPSDEERHAQELKADRGSGRWVDAIEGVPAEVLAASYDKLCGIIDREGESAGEKFLINLGRKFRNRA